MKIILEPSKVLLSLVVTLLFFTDSALAQTANNQVARGVVFHDENSNGIRDERERGVSSVCVSNGREVVETNRRGEYELPLDDDTILFVIKPEDWTTSFDANNIPRFYYIHKPSGSPELEFGGIEPTGPLPPSVDFPLYRSRESDEFKVLFLGDPQPYTIQQVEYVIHDVIEEIAGSDAAFGITLGDCVGDDLRLLKPLIEAEALVGIPWYHVYGNHDRDTDAPDFDSFDDTYQALLGPTHYSFNFGDVHFININTVYSKEDAGYKGMMTDEQLEFMRNDLAFVPEDKLIVLMMHIPLVEVENRQEVYRIIESRPHTFSISAHWHRQAHFFIDESDGWKGERPHHHLVNVTACGSWWRGAFDERGIPHATMSDGAPNGYTIATFDDNEYSLEYRAAARPANYQMGVFAPAEITVSEAGDTDVYANVFAGTPRCKVEMRLGQVGPWIEMVRVEEHDPYYLQQKEWEKSENPPKGPDLPNPSKSTHLWKAQLPVKPPPGTHLIQVQARDIFGKEYQGNRAIRIKADGE